MVKKVRELSARDKVGLAAYAVLGKDYLSEAFRCTHDIRNAKSQSIYSMQSRWINGQQEKEFIESIRNQYADLILQNISEDIKLSNEQLNTIIQRGIVSEKDPKRQADMSIKLMQWRKDAKAELTEDERRKYVLAWRSICRACPLMATFRVIQEDPGLQGKEYNERVAAEPARMIDESRKAQEAARNRIVSGCKQSGDDTNSEALGRMFSALGITVSDCYDIADYLKRIEDGGGRTNPHWMKR